MTEHRYTNVADGGPTALMHISKLFVFSSTFNTKSVFEIYTSLLASWLQC